MAFETSILTSDRGKFVLKLGREPRLGAELAGEHRVLNQLAKHRPFVPEPLAFVVQDGVAMSLLSYVAGINLVEAIRDVDVAARHTLVAGYAWTLRRIHSWQTNLLQPDDWLTKAVDRVARHIKAGVIPSPIAQPGQFDGADLEALLVELRQWRSSLGNDLVFSHGDYCLPNVLVVDGSVSGIVDWPAGGYADRRYDLATAVWSLRFNLGEESYVDTFLSAYGYRDAVETLRYFEALYILT